MKLYWPNPGRGGLPGDFLNARYHDGKKLWTARASSTANRACIREKASKGRAEATAPKSPRTARKFPVKCTRPERPAREKPRFSADPFNDLASVKLSPVKITNAPSATRSNVN